MKKLIPTITMSTMIAALSISASTAYAATLVAGYDFLGGSPLEDKVGSFDLTETTEGSGGVTFSTEGNFSFASFDNSGTDNESAGYSGANIVQNHPSAISMWVRSASASSGARIFTVNGVIVEFAPTNRVRTRDGGGTNAFAANDSYALNSWNLITVYIDKDQPNGTLSLFVNDANVATTPADSSKYGIGVTGFSIAPTNSTFAGDIGGVRVHSGIANATDAEALHDSLLTDGGPIAIPEPATMSLLGLGGLALLRRRRK
jgi:hypothetical protein